jgi:hypothetical protein
MPFLSEFSSAGGAPGYRLRLITGKFIDDNPEPVAIRDFTVQNGNFMITTTDSKVYIGRSVNRLERAYTGGGNFGDFVLANQVTRDVYIGGDPYGTQFTSAIGTYATSTTTSPYIREYDGIDNYYGPTAATTLSTDSKGTLNNESTGAISKFIVSPAGRLFYVSVGAQTLTTRTIRIYEWDPLSYTFQLSTFTNNSGNNISLTAGRVATGTSTGNVAEILLSINDLVSTIEQAGNSLVMYFGINGIMYQLEISGTGEAVVTLSPFVPSASISSYSGSYDLAINTNPTARRAILMPKARHNSFYLYFNGTGWQNLVTDTFNKPLNQFRGAAYSITSGRFYTISSANPSYSPGVIHWTTTPDILDSWQPDTNTDIKMCYYLRNDSGSAYASTGATTKTPTANQEIVSAPTECLIQKLS